MPGSGYTAITFVANEQPTTAKWNLIGSNFASLVNGNGFDDDFLIARHVADGAILPNALKASASTNNDWNWDTWASPIASGLAVGSTGQVRARYMRVGDTVFYSFEMLLGGSGISVGDVILNLPVEAYSSIGGGTPYL